MNLFQIIALRAIIQSTTETIVVLCQNKGMSSDQAKLYYRAECLDRYWIDRLNLGDNNLESLRNFFDNEIDRMYESEIIIILECV